MLDFVSVCGRRKTSSILHSKHPCMTETRLTGVGFSPHQAIIIISCHMEANMSYITENVIAFGHMEWSESSKIFFILCQIVE